MTQAFQSTEPSGSTIAPARKKAAISVPAAVAAKFKYREPAAYRAFWHLEAAGVLLWNAANGHFTSDIWAAAGNWPKAAVAMIDNGVDSGHPYLQAGIRDALDLTGMPVAPWGGPASSADAPFSGIVAIAKRLSAKWAAADKQALRNFAAKNSVLAPFDADAPNSANRLFAMHGTSAAGLVMARMPSPPSHGGDRPGDMVYFGADPDGELIPITTSFGPSPDKLVLALLHALASDADVIFIPRSFSSAVLDEKLATAEAPAPGLDGADPAQGPMWRMLQLVLLAASREVPIVCAAGNDGAGSLIAPAAFADEAKWGKNGVIAVGAMNYHGMRASYSNYGAGLTLAAPSDDGEMFTRDQARLDVTDAAIMDFPYGETVVRQNLANLYDYAEQDILAIDIAGDFGAVGDAGLGKANSQQGGVFTGFGGTSAASAIVAGVCSLIQRKAKSNKGGQRLTGDQMKVLLTSTARKNGLPHLDGASGTTAFAPDFINGGLLTFGQAFGAGLVNAAAAVAAVK